METKPILHLNLTSKWYDMIEGLIKLEEYREQKPYWNRIFEENGNIKIKGKWYHPTDVVVCFSNGYSKDRRQMFWTLKNIRSSFGKTEWGASGVDQYHTLILGERMIKKQK